MRRERSGGHIKPKKRFQWEEKGQVRGKARDTSGSGSLKDARGGATAVCRDCELEEVLVGLLCNKGHGWAEGRELGL